jgi:hypothetical protein
MASFRTNERTIRVNPRGLVKWHTEGARRKGIADPLDEPGFLMTEIQVIPIISILVAMASLSWAVYVTIRKGDISRPTLKVSIGLTAVSKDRLADGESDTKRIERSTLILAGRLEDDETGFFPIYVTVRNTSNTAVRNVQVSLKYPAEHYLRDLSQVSAFKFADNRKIKSESTEHRNVTTFGGTTDVRQEFDLIRSGEGVILPEIVVWRTSPTPEAISELETLPLKQRMAHVGVSGYFPLDVFVAAENCRPTAKRFNILWINHDFKSQDEEAMSDTIQRVTKGFWGRMPSPGFYFRPFWPWRKPIIRWEGAEIVILDLVDATHAGKKFRVTEWEPIGEGLAKIPMPTWNYHSEPRPNLEANRIPFLSKIVRWRPFSRRTRSGEISDNDGGS